MAGYTRQSSYTDGDIINAADSNDEFDQILAAFNNSSGHKHDGTASEGPVIGLIGDAGSTTPKNKVVVDNANDQIEVSIDVSGTSTEQFVIKDGVIEPTTDDDIDLGSSGKQFKDLYIDGTANIDSLVADTADINGGTMDGVVIGGVTAAAADFTTVNSTGAMIATGGFQGVLTGSVLGNTTVTSGTSTFNNVTASATVQYGSLSDGTITITGFVDEDNMVSDSATLVPTQQSVKAYVDAQVTAQDLDFSADTGGALSIDLDSESLTLTGGTGIDTSGSGNAVTFAIDSTVATLTGTQTLTNKTIDVDNNTVSNIEVDNFKSGVLDTDLTSVAATDTTLASAKAIKTYVDAQVTAQDLDFQGDSGGALSIDLDSESLTIAGGTGIDTSGAINTLTVAIDSTVATLTGSQTLTNKTLTSAVLNGTISGTSIKDEDDMSSDSADHLATQQSIKAYVDSQVTAQDLDFQADTGGALSIDLDSETMTFTGGTGIDTSGSGNAVTFAIDSTVATLTGTQTLTNKTLTSPTINGGSLSSAVTGATQTAGTNNTTIATTAFAATVASNEAVALAIALG